MPQKCLPQALRPNQSPLCSGQYTSLRVQHRPPPRRGPHHKSHTQNSLPAVAASPRRRLHLLHCLTYISYMQKKRHHPSRPAHSGLRGWVVWGQVMDPLLPLPSDASVGSGGLMLLCLPLLSSSYCITFTRFGIPTRLKNSRQGGGGGSKRTNA